MSRNARPPNAITRKFKSPLNPLVVSMASVGWSFVINCTIVERSSASPTVL